MNELEPPGKAKAPGEISHTNDGLFRAENSQLLLIDHRSAEQCFVTGAQLKRLADNVKALSGLARTLRIPTTIVTRVVSEEEASDCGSSVTQFPGGHLIEQSALNIWEEVAVQKVLAENARRFLVVSELWADDSDFCFTLSAMKAANYKAYLVTDASGSFSPAKDREAFKVLEEAGVQLLCLEEIINAWQRAPKEARLMGVERAVEQFPSLD